VRRLLDLVQHIVQVRAQGVDVFRIERRNERLVQSRENLVDDFVALFSRSAIRPAAYSSGRRPRQRLAAAGRQPDRSVLPGERRSGRICLREEAVSYGFKERSRNHGRGGSNSLREVTIMSKRRRNVKLSRRNHSRLMNASLVACGKGSSAASASAPARALGSADPAAATASGCSSPSIGSASGADVLSPTRRKFANRSPHRALFCEHPHGTTGAPHDWA